MKVEKILVGIDFGQDTERVLAYASLFAKAMGASLDLLFVIDYLVTPPAYLIPYIEEEKKAAEERFRALRERLEKYGVPVKAEVMVGRLHESFDAAARRAKADMLVLGFRSHTFRRSSSEKLIKGLAMPVLVVRGGRTENSEIGSVEIRKIICATDFSEISRKAAKTARELGELFRSELSVVHVLPSHVIEERLDTGVDLERAKRELLEQAVDGLKSVARDSGTGKAGMIVEGDPYHKILSFSSDMAADLIVMGGRGNSPSGGLLIGSVTDAVLKSAPCPVLVVH